MMFGVSLADYDWKILLILGIGAIVLIAVIALFINKGRYAARYKAFYKKLDKVATKRYNSNLFIEYLINNEVKDQTNTFKSLKSRGKTKVKNYIDFYVKNLPELVVLKSYISPDKNKNELVMMVLDETDRVLYKWDKSKKTIGLIKAANKYQMLTPILGFLYELPMNINEGLPFRFKNHDNDYTLTYEIVRNAKQTKHKVKEKKLSRTERKAQEKLEILKAKKLKKNKR
jgi:hypothetical protein